jgi:hypothetical protein
MQDLNDKVTGGNLTAAEWNEVPSEIQNVIEATGQTLSSGDLNQLGKGVAEYAASGAFYTDSGAADAYVLTATGGKQAPAAYADGQTFTFVTANANTGASTANPGGLGVKNIKLADGTDPGAGAINGRTTLHYDLGNDRLEISGGSAAMQVFTADGTYTPAANVKSIKITATAAGGGSGGVDGQGVGTAAISAPGGAGATSILTTSEIDASYTLVVGAGGAAGASGNNAGSAGGVTSVSSTAVTISCPGGLGGSGQLGSAGSWLNQGAGANTAAPTGGQINLIGAGGNSSVRTDGNLVSIGQPGSSYWGPGGKDTTINGAGATGISFGSGATSSISVGGATNYAGAAGAGGVVVVEEFF